MKLLSVNKLEDISKYGFTHSEIKYDNDAFGGHQMGSIVARVNIETNEIEANYLLDTLDNREELIKELLTDTSVKLVKNRITQLDETTNKLVDKMLYFMPYVPENHSSRMPTISEDGMEPTSNAHYEGKIEVLFLFSEGIKRYVVVNFSSKNIPMLKIMADAFDDRDEFEEVFKDSDTRIKYKKENYDHDAGYAMECYNDSGERYNQHLSLDELAEAVASLRLIELNCIIDK